eukprot:UN16662
MREIHDRVEGDFVKHLYKTCEEQKHSKSTLIRKASRSKGVPRTKLLEEASNVKQTSCERLNTYLDEA